MMQRHELFWRKLVPNLFSDSKNRPFSSSKDSRFQNEAKCKTFLVKMSGSCMRIKDHFLINRFALGLALRQRLEATRKWPITFEWMFFFLPIVLFW